MGKEIEKANKKLDILISKVQHPDFKKSLMRMKKKGWVESEYQVKKIKINDKFSYKVPSLDSKDPNIILADFTVYWDGNSLTADAVLELDEKAKQYGNNGKMVILEYFDSEASH